MSTAATIFEGFTELAAAVSSERKTLYISLAYGQMNAVAWGSLYEMGAAYLAAHMLAVTPGGEGSIVGAAGTGAIVDEKALTRFRRFSDIQAMAASIEDAALARTTYGQEFLRLRAMCPAQQVVTSL